MPPAEEASDDSIPAQQSLREWPKQLEGPDCLFTLLIKLAQNFVFKALLQQINIQL